MVIVPMSEGAAPRVPVASGTATFHALWNALADLLGTAATAAIVGRAARRAARRNPGLTALTIERVDHEFGYLLPHEFDETGELPVSLRALLEELHPLLVQLTGRVALGSLAQIPGLREWAGTAAVPAS